MNILNKADEIVNKRKEEKERFYGPFEEGMEKAAKIASIISFCEFGLIKIPYFSEINSSYGFSFETRTGKPQDIASSGAIGNASPLLNKIKTLYFIKHFSGKLETPISLI